MVFARIYINSESSQAYFQAFKNFFDLANKVLASQKLQVKWQHLDQEGLHAVVVDMDPKQAHGRKYL